MDNFEEYMCGFKQKPLEEKQKIVIDELKALTVFTNKMCESIGAENNILFDKEQADLNDENYSQDDYSEAILVYISSIKDSLCAFSDTLTDINEKL